MRQQELKKYIDASRVRPLAPYCLAKPTQPDSLQRQAAIPSLFSSCSSLLRQRLQFSQLPNTAPVNWQDLSLQDQTIMLCIGNGVIISVQDTLLVSHFYKPRYFYTILLQIMSYKKTITSELCYGIGQRQSRGVTLAGSCTTSPQELCKFFFHNFHIGDLYRA